MADVGGCAEAMEVEPPLSWASSGGGEVAQSSGAAMEAVVDETVNETRKRGKKSKTKSGDKRARQANAGAE